MTVVAYREGTLAADSRVTEDALVLPGSFRKVIKRPTGVYAYCGKPELFSHFLAKYVEEDEDCLPQWNDNNTCILHMDNEGCLWSYNGEGNWFDLTGMEFYAMGSGSAYAYGAMDNGADAVSAVRTATKYDIYCGGSIFAYRHGDEAEYEFYG